jgi:hypothetical protein
MSIPCAYSQRPSRQEEEGSLKQVDKLIDPSEFVEALLRMAGGVLRTSNRPAFNLLLLLRASI